MSHLQNLLASKKIELDDLNVSKLEKLIRGKSRIVKKSWDILKNNLQQNISTRDAQEICASLFGYRNRNALVAIENKKDFPIKEWIKQNNIKNEFLKFAYESWFFIQAQPRHKKRLDIVNPNEIFVTKNTVLKGLFEIENKYFLSHKNTNKTPDHIPNYLIFKNLSKFNIYFKNVIDNEKNNVDIDYSIFDINLNKLDYLKFGNYFISLPKKLSHVIIGGAYAQNCMENSQNVQNSYTKIKTNIANFNNGINCNYMDAHIIDDRTGRLVGIFALEEIFITKRKGSPNRSLFVNFTNGFNEEMEHSLLNLINHLYGIKGTPSEEFLRQPRNQPIQPLPIPPSIHGGDGKIYLVEKEILDEWTKHFKN